jgi:hypothetical protein
MPKKMIEAHIGPLIVIADMWCKYLNTEHGSRIMAIYDGKMFNDTIEVPAEFEIIMEYLRERYPQSEVFRTSWRKDENSNTSPQTKSLFDKLVSTSVFSVYRLYYGAKSRISR